MKILNITLNKIEATIVAGGVYVCYGTEDSFPGQYYNLGEFNSEAECKPECPRLGFKKGYSKSFCSGRATIHPVSSFISRAASPSEYE